VGQVSGKVNWYSGAVIDPPDGQFEGYDSFDGVFWNDTNGDGKVQFEECEIVRYGENKKSPRQWTDVSIPLGAGRGQRLDSDFVLYVNSNDRYPASYTNGCYRYRPVSFNNGAPVYSSKSLEQWKADDWDTGDWLSLPAEDRVVCLSWRGYAGPTKIAGYDTVTGVLQWTYPNDYPGVHGSHRAPMPSAGVVIGPNNILGIVDMGEGIGNIFGMRGNLGQDFFMTTDGLFVGTMFPDCRLPREGLPATEKEVIGAPMEVYSNGSEPFNGWMGRQADGKIRMTTGYGESATILTVKGFENVKRFTAEPLTVGAEELAKAEAANLTRAEKEAVTKVYTLKPRVNQWEGIPELIVDRAGYPHKATVTMAYDTNSLHLSYLVTDNSPWMNEGKDVRRLFKTGDAVDFQIKVTEGAAKNNNDLTDCVRILMSQLGGKPVAVLMRPVDPTADKDLAFEYASPVMKRHFDRVEVAEDIKVVVDKRGEWYRVTATIPWTRLGITPKQGLRLKADAGFIASDASGTINTARIYWANKDTNLISDLPAEAWMYPTSWGEIVFE